MGKPLYLHDLSFQLSEAKAAVKPDSSCLAGTNLGLKNLV